MILTTAPILVSHGAGYNFKFDMSFRFGALFGLLRTWFRGKLLRGTRIAWRVEGAVFLCKAGAMAA